MSDHDGREWFSSLRLCRPMPLSGPLLRLRDWAGIMSAPRLCGDCLDENVARGSALQRASRQRWARPMTEDWITRTER